MSALIAVLLLAHFGFLGPIIGIALLFFVGYVVLVLLATIVYIPLAALNWAIPTKSNNPYPAIFMAFLLLAAVGVWRHFYP